MNSLLHSLRVAMVGHVGESHVAAVSWETFHWTGLYHDIAQVKMGWVWPLHFVGVTATFGGCGNSWVSAMSERDCCFE